VFKTTLRALARRVTVLVEPSGAMAASTHNQPNDVIDIDIDDAPEAQHISIKI